MQPELRQRLGPWQCRAESQQSHPLQHTRGWSYRGEGPSCHVTILAATLCSVHQWLMVHPVPKLNLGLVGGRWQRKPSLCLPVA